MYVLFPHLVRLMTPTTTTTNPRLGHAVVPRRLLENAEVRAGNNPRQAEELRGNALAYLRVVR